ncbi:non-specific lipid-transfer protein 1-like [Herrania umbratica]|uniref:Non-specific lipid-transfer protein n=1 Tax=Herrania umbratica TaxID=108875 RepID=A0A6J1AY72_9ROSI|nr:non-specific lipid-transfer protein 1-like [Herrania umbratica]
MASLKLVCALVLCILVVEPMATSAISCGDVASKLSSCLRYLQGGRSLPSNCCAGIRSLNAQARDKRSRQAVCRCLQNAAKTMTGLKTNLVEGLPRRCGVKIPYKISTSTNCNRVK